MKFLILTALVIAATAVDVYPKPAYPAKTYEYAAQPYSFSYAVGDQPSYNHYSHSESSDAKVVSGSYKVLLPDGRTQTVTYKDEGYGYVADVKYDGHAAEYKPAYKPATNAAYPVPAKY